MDQETCAETQVKNQTELKLSGVTPQTPNIDGSIVIQSELSGKQAKRNAQERNAQVTEVPKTRPKVAKPAWTGLSNRLISITTNLKNIQWVV